MNNRSVINLRMQRLGFSAPAETIVEYNELFRRLQPVSTEYFTSPGSPPALRDRSVFDDIAHNREARGNQELIKARFQGTTISYVLRDEFELYSSAFCKPVRSMDDELMELYGILNEMGPMEKRQLMEEMDMKGPVISRMLQKLQKAFLVYELQPDTFGEQVWMTFESEWPEFDIDRIPADEARKIVIQRFVHNMVCADDRMVSDWTRFSMKECAGLAGSMVSDGTLGSFMIGNESFYYNHEDRDVIFGDEEAVPVKSVFVIHKADYLYRAFESALKERYKGVEVLQFLLIDGEFKGAVAGHWRIGPHDAEDIILELPGDEAAARRKEIMDEVSRFYGPPYSNILRYNGESL